MAVGDAMSDVRSGLDISWSIPSDPAVYLALLPDKSTKKFV